jgi:peptidyl-prolyl cis-trans isomerase B (cyclophilin B)
MTFRRALALGLLLLLSACGDSAVAVDSPEYRAFREQATACDAERPDPAREMKFTRPDDLDLSGAITATLRTSCGDIVLQLIPDLAPATVNSFVYLAEHGYFDGTVSHRIYPGFVVQLGDPTATGRGGPGYRIGDELPPADFAYLTGMVAMANRGPNTSGSQFFIVLADSGLDPDYSVFGFVASGWEVLQRIVAIPVGPNPTTLEPSYPLETLYLETVTIQR